MTFTVCALINNEILTSDLCIDHYATKIFSLIHQIKNLRRRKWLVVPINILTFRIIKLSGM